MNFRLKIMPDLLIDLKHVITVEHITMKRYIKLAEHGQISI